jgi:hypothetical protein
MFDIVIPLGPSDKDVIQHQLEYTKKNIIGYRNIYIVSSILDLELPDCIVIPESIFPFTLQHVAEYLTQNHRNGWYLQQLLKLYAGSIIPGILDRYLVIDADTFFMKPVTFIDEDKLCYNVGNEYNLPYFNHINTLFGDRVYKVNKKWSGICHHMIFDQKYLAELFAMVETAHGMPFWRAFLSSVSPTYILGSGASKYEIYFNYMLIYHKDEIIVRPLQWKNSETMDLSGNYDYISIHWYSRKEQGKVVLPKT